jgi:hypothetical protein
VLALDVSFKKLSVLSLDVFVRQQPGRCLAYIGIGFVLQKDMSVYKSLCWVFPQPFFYILRTLSLSIGKQEVNNCLKYKALKSSFPLQCQQKHRQYNPPVFRYNFVVVLEVHLLIPYEAQPSA